MTPQSIYFNTAATFAKKSVHPNTVATSAKKSIYLNTAATSLQKPPCVAQAVVEALGSLGNASRGNAERDLGADRSIMEARRRLASLFGFSHPERVVFASGATQALNMAIWGAAAAIMKRKAGSEGRHAVNAGQEAFGLKPDDEPRTLTIVSTDLEHSSVLRPLYRLRDAYGAELRFARADRTGHLDFGELEALCTPEVDLVVCTHASNLIGELVDIRRVARAAHRCGAVLIVDAAQTAGAYPIDMEDMGIDILCFTGHKSLLGPQGTGGLCVSPGIEVTPLVTGGTGVSSYEEGQPEAYPAHLEAGTLNGHGIAGLSAAVEFIQEWKDGDALQGPVAIYGKELALQGPAAIHGKELALQGPVAIHIKELALRDRFIEAVSDIPGIEIYGPGIGSESMPIVALNLAGLESWETADLLAQEYGIAVRAGAHCAPRMHRALGTEKSGAVRFSFGLFNTREEVETAARALREIAESI
ncbi:MAG: aminotransferase class V-fold PLP-dependent enzyme [Lachnospiraceae bacterium]|nr:aminotransferase class V-fold PLP-dependent enzyme [Lachnospiraceae bacterium]